MLVPGKILHGKSNTIETFYNSLMQAEPLTSVVCNNEESLITVAKLLIEKYPDQKFFALYGEMGAGKTTFIKAICTLLQATDIINSPTFSIVNIYKTNNSDEIFHFDFYRMKSLEEVYDIGYEDYFYSESFCFVEWPEKVESLLPENCTRVFIDVNNNGSRTIRF
jgi:tRNA threonylcarbamoyladenosine biosynthesis protein TsaE